MDVSKLVPLEGECRRQHLKLKTHKRGPDHTGTSVFGSLLGETETAWPGSDRPILSV
jgi:hypothetical protein